MADIDTAHIPTAEELEDFWASEDLLPARTATACIAVGCSCVEWSEGQVIAGYRCCHVCSHSVQVHKPRKQSKTTKRGN